MLVTTAAVTGFEHARTRVEWYTGRWGIEVYHSTLKSGCRIEDRQLGTAGRLEACLGVDMVVAWRVFHLAMLGRETPDAPCTAFFQDAEWKALCCYVHKTPTPPEPALTLGEALRMVGSLGGHLGRRRDGPPARRRAGAAWNGWRPPPTYMSYWCTIDRRIPSNPAHKPTVLSVSKGQPAGWGEGGVSFHKTTPSFGVGARNDRGGMAAVKRKGWWPAYARHRGRALPGRRASPDVQPLRAPTVMPRVRRRCRKR